LAGVIWDFGNGWYVQPMPRPGAYDAYRVNHTSGYFVDVLVDRAIPSDWYGTHALRLINEAMTRGETIMAADAMFGGGDVRPEPDGA
jgi:hypothetical protein